jgi:GNAT superfamily N-acetyltransferase
MEFAPVFVQLNADRVFRSLRARDVESLVAFYDGLGDEARSFWQRDADGHALAAEHCGDIDRYDKLRLVLDTPDGITELYELTFTIPEGDRARFAAYGCELREDTDVRFGPCVADSEKGTGLATRLLNETALIARREGRTRLLLWGGVQQDNARARRFYAREGFHEVGQTGDIIDMVRRAT